MDSSNNLLFDVAQVADKDKSQVVAWGVECIRRANQQRDGPLTLDASCREDDTERIAWLERHGFVHQPSRSLRMVRSLNELVPDPQLPPGFVIRHVTGEHQAEALVALHRAAFGTQNLTIQDRLSWMRTPEYDPELDLIAIAPDGVWAACCMCHVSQEENAHTGRNECYTDPVATRPLFQRRGLARALLLTGFRLLKQRGVETAVLGTSSENIAMQQAARSVGFCVTVAKVWFAKPVHATHPLLETVDDNIPRRPS
jgi:mycothiol synthase